ncbi:MAG: iron ABC transporter permease [Candidatus Erginobacter occultus]|nr:iron ABC transporter permease [Candidatus Erginobacter occultus]
MRNMRRINSFFLVLAAVTAAVVILALSIGTVSFSPARVLRMTASAIFGAEDSSLEAVILLRLRLPRVILGLIVGGGLAVAGVIFQGIFRNPLVEPYTLGVSGGAALGISLAFILGPLFPRFTLPLFGFAGAWLAVSTAYAIARRRRFLRIPYLLLIGVMISFISSALIMLLLSVADLHRFRAVIYWTMGSLDSADPVLLWFAIPVIVLGSAAALTRAWTLNALELGEEGAIGLGVRLRRDQRQLFFLGSLLAGTAVAAAGVIGFVGLVVPHVVRLFLGNDHRLTIPASFLAGGTFLVFCDLIARTVRSPAELPVGVVTGIIGGSLFIYFLASGRGRGEQ